MSMTIALGTPVTLPDGRQGVVIPAPVSVRDRVLVKVKAGNKVWCRVEDCTLAVASP
jgi:hypothetical protein